MPSGIIEQLQINCGTKKKVKNNVKFVKLYIMKKDEVTSTNETHLITPEWLDSSSGVESTAGQ